MIDCPKCGGHARVYGTREDMKRKTYRRFRRCQVCKHKWVTIEIEDVEQPIGFIPETSRQAMITGRHRGSQEARDRALAMQMNIPVEDLDIYRGFREKGAKPQQAAEMVRRLNDNTVG